MAINIFEIRQAIMDGQLFIYEKRGMVYLKDRQTEECVIIGTAGEDEAAPKDYPE